MPPRKQVTAPVAQPKPENPNIPLHCLLCPKKPKFSDVSHLLTHVSSKSHLSNRFKAEIRSHKDPELRDALEQFESWWRRYNIRELLCDRMDAKDNKAAPKRSRGQSPEVSRAAVRASSIRQASANHKPAVQVSELHQEGQVDQVRCRAPLTAEHQWITPRAQHTPGLQRR